MIKVKGNKLLLLKFHNEEKANLEETRKSERIKSMPVRVTLNTNKNCNLKCKICGFSTKGQNYDKDRMKYEILEKISEELFPTSWQIIPSTIGEPLMYENFSDLFQLIGEYHCRVELYTNGVLLDEQMSRKILPFLSDLKISFDGASKTTFENLRKGANYETVIHNIILFNELRKNFQYVSPPTLTLQYTLSRSNVEEFPSAANLSSKLGIDRIAASHVYIFNPKHEFESLFFHQDLSDKKLLEAYEISETNGLITFFPRLFKKRNNRTAFLFKENTCSYLYKETWINANGDVHPCFLPDSPVMGNLSSQSFQEIWNGSAYLNMRRTVNSSTPVFSRCKNCPIRMQFDLRFTKGYDRRGFLFY